MRFRINHRLQDKWGSENKGGATTNTRPNSKQTLKVDCVYKWSFVQVRTYVRMAKQKGVNAKYGDVPNFEIIRANQPRALRISATYARLYLEMADVEGTPSKKGRYYWPALGAFAVKQVYCGFKFAENMKKGLEVVDALPGIKKQINDVEIMLGGMSRGNFWLCQEITPWHLFYNKWPEDFNECVNERNEATFQSAVRENLRKFPWRADGSISKLDGFKATDHLKKGFALIKEIENMPISDKGRPAKQFESLIWIAKHEQNIVLQRLTYDDPDVQRILNTQAYLEWVPGMMKREVFFCAACETDNKYLNIRMGKDDNGNDIPEEKDLFNADDRWYFVERVSKRFHELMQRYPDYMEGELRTMAGWADK